MKLLITTQAVDKNDPILGFFHNWIIEFSKHFEVIHVICLREGFHELPKNVHVHSLGKENGANRFKYVFRFYKNFYNIFVHAHVDVVFFHMGAIYNILAVPFFAIRKIQKTKFVWWKTHGVLNRIGKIALMCVDEVVTAGNKSFNAHTEKVRVVGHAIDTSAFTPHVSTHAHTNVRVLAVGRVTPIKKLEIAVDVVAEYVMKKNKNIIFDMYGPVSTISYKNTIDTKITKNALEGTVRFCGEKTPTEMQSLYHEYDVLIHPAYEAGFDKVILEAMASGVIPVTSIQSFKPILEPFGLYVAPNDVDHYVEVLSRIQNMGEEERGKLHQELRDIVVKSHSSTTLSERIFGVL